MTNIYKGKEMSINFDKMSTKEFMEKHFSKGKWYLLEYDETDPLNNTDSVTGRLNRDEILTAFGFELKIPSGGNRSPMISSTENKTLYGRPTLLNETGLIVSNSRELSVTSEPVYINENWNMSTGDKLSYTFIDDDYIYKLTLIAGQNKDVVVFEKVDSRSVDENNENNNNDEQTPINILVGARPVESTPLVKGTIFASPDGTGTGGENDPTSFTNALSIMKPGDTLFLRGGVYNLSMDGLKRAIVDYSKSGTVDNYTVIESYPGETAIIDGSMLDRFIDIERQQGSLRIEAEYIKVRGLEVRNMPEHGILITKDNNIIEGCITHHNGLTGIYAHHVDNVIVRDNVSHHNSDVGLGVNKWNYDDGDNADGIAIAYSTNCLIEHNTVYLNSDDGIDIWGSSNTIIQRNKSYKNGWLDDGTHANKGNGNGIKTGGQNCTGNVVRRNMVWDNFSNGIDISENTNLNVTYEYNTSYHNGYNGSTNQYLRGRGYTFNPDTKLIKNISSEDAQYFWNSNGIFTDNSWDRNGNSWNNPGIVTFINVTDPNNPDFLKPTPDSGYVDIGALAVEN